MRRRQAQGFTLLEVIIALAILGMSLMAIFDLNAGAVANHGYTKRLTIASLLARGKMTDIEQQLTDEGFQLDDQELSGDFSEEGWDSFKWRAKVVAPKTSGVSPEKFMGALFNLPIGGEGGDASNPLAALGGALSGGTALPGAAQAAGMQAMAGNAASGLMQTQFTQMMDQISKSVREVHLTVSWKDGNQTESLDLVTHVVSTGRGSDKNGRGAQQLTGPNGQPLPGGPMGPGGQPTPTGPVPGGMGNPGNPGQRGLM